MFSQEYDGYNKNEVDRYIQNMRANYESKLMEEKLKALDSEKKVLDMKNERLELENKERNIMTALNAIEKAKKFQEEGPRTFYNLIMDKLQLLLKELNLKFPELRKDDDFHGIMDEFLVMVTTFKKSLEKTTDINHPISTENDSMRMLLTKMQDYKKGQDVPQQPKEVKISINKKVPDVRAVPEKVSGFRLEEALNPTEDLEEIMKAFDFYNQANN